MRVKRQGIFNASEKLFLAPPAIRTLKLNTSMNVSNRKQPWILSSPCIVYTSTFILGVPTLKEKAQLIVDSLHLSIDAKVVESTTAPAKVVISDNEATVPVHADGYPTASDDIPKFNESVILIQGTYRGENHTFNISLTRGLSLRVDPHGDQSNSPRGRRQAPPINYCPTPSQQANNRICPNMCDIDRPGRPQGKHYSMCTLHSETLVKSLCVK